MSSGDKPFFQWVSLPSSNERRVFEDAGVLCSLIGREIVYPCERELQLLG